jgi:hypothetical protein
MEDDSIDINDLAYALRHMNVYSFNVIKPTISFILLDVLKEFPR